MIFNIFSIGVLILNWYAVKYKKTKLIYITSILCIIIFLIELIKLI